MSRRHLWDKVNKNLWANSLWDDRSHRNKQLSSKNAWSQIKRMGTRVSFLFHQTRRFSSLQIRK